MVRAAEIAMNNQSDSNKKRVQDLFKNARAKYLEDYQQLTKRNGNLSELLAYAERISHFTRTVDVIGLDTLKSANTNTGSI